MRCRSTKVEEINTETAFALGRAEPVYALGGPIVCLDCGFAERSLPGEPLSKLRERRSSSILRTRSEACRCNRSGAKGGKEPTICDYDDKAECAEMVYVAETEKTVRPSIRRQRKVGVARSRSNRSLKGSDTARASAAELRSRTAGRLPLVTYDSPYPCLVGGEKAPRRSCCSVIFKSETMDDPRARCVRTGSYLLRSSYRDQRSFEAMLPGGFQIGRESMES